MSIIKYSIVFLTGIYVGQEYGNTIPNVKNYMIKSYNDFKNTDFYKRVYLIVNRVNLAFFIL